MVLDVCVWKCSIIYAVNPADPGDIAEYRKPGSARTTSAGLDMASFTHRNAVSTSSKSSLLFDSTSCTVPAATKPTQTATATNTAVLRADIMASTSNQPVGSTHFAHRHRYFELSPQMTAVDNTFVSQQTSPHCTPSAEVSCARSIPQLRFL